MSIEQPCSRVTFLNIITCASKHDWLERGQVRRDGVIDYTPYRGQKYSTPIIIVHLATFFCLDSGDYSYCGPQLHNKNCCCCFGAFTRILYRIQSASGLNITKSPNDRCQPHLREYAIFTSERIFLSSAGSVYCFPLFTAFFPKGGPCKVSLKIPCFSIFRPIEWLYMT